MRPEGLADRLADHVARPIVPEQAGEPPSVPGVLTADDTLATAAAIVAVQQPDGAIGWPDGHVDAWNHVECLMALSACGLREAVRRGYEWLSAAQQPDGSWPRAIAGGAVTDGAAESNHAAYPAVGVWHELLVTGDEAFARQRRADGTPGDHALLAGCSSIHHGLRCGIALAERLGEPQPDWELAADALAEAVASRPSAFADKSRFSMDWYYPVLGGVLGGDAAAGRIAAGWDTFVVPGLGVRCVSDQPWVTGAETCELVLALEAI